MAAALASWIKGQDVVADADQLRVFAADQLDISALAFDGVVEVLLELDFVRNVERRAGRVRSFYESVPPTHEAMYERLGSSWHDRGPTEIETSLLESVDDLSRGPLAVDELAIDPAARPAVLQLGQQAEAIRVIQVGGRSIAYSPFFSFERPAAVREALESVDLHEMRRAVEDVRRYQGLPLSVSPHGDVLTRLVGAGLVSGPGLDRPEGTAETFAVLPYGLPPDLRTLRKPILEKAQAVVAAVRMGQHFGGMTRLFSATLVLERLLEPDRVVARHSSTPRQYAVLQKLGIVRFEKAHWLTGIRLIEDRDGDNRAAVRVAIDLLQFGEAADTKELHPDQEASLLVTGNYLPPIQSVRPAREKDAMKPDELREIVEAMMGRRPSE